MFIFANLLLLGLSLFHANAFRVTIEHEDLDLAPSGKHEEWEKGEEEDHYGEHEEKKGEKGEKGYESDHECVFYCNFVIFLTLK